MTDIPTTAEKIVTQIEDQTLLFDPRREALFPHFDYSELLFGRVLGRGAFSVVKEIKSIHLDPGGQSALLEKEIDIHHPEYDEEYLQAFTRDFLEARCTAGEDARYAIKILSSECKEAARFHLQGTVDLAVEAKFLAVLEHPHIIKMRAMSGVGLFHDQSFIVLDRLYDTLVHRINKWRKATAKSSGLIGALTGGKKKVNELTVKRLLVAYDLANALKYMHGKSIIYRDLKPENIGFDVRDDVKIFDFGLAKQLDPSKVDADGLYKLTGYTGSLRYMAPEIALSQPYNLKADVFSFGILFWSIMSLESPFATYNTKMHDKLVVRGGYRPACNKMWPDSWVELMKSSWDSDIHKRKSMREVTAGLSGFADKLQIDRPGYDMDMSVRGSMNRHTYHESDKLEKNTYVYHGTNGTSPADDSYDKLSRSMAELEAEWGEA